MTFDVTDEAAATGCRPERSAPLGGLVNSAGYQGVFSRSTATRSTTRVASSR